MHKVGGLIYGNDSDIPLYLRVAATPWMIHRVANAYSCSTSHCYVASAAYVRNVELDPILQSINPSLLESCSLQSVIAASTRRLTAASLLESRPIHRGKSLNEQECVYYLDLIGCTDTH